VAKEDHDKVSDDWMKQETTNRGFSKITFDDYYNAPCSLQESSCGSANAIWLGVEDASPEILSVDAVKYGLNPGKDYGWVPYPIPPEVSINTRMHLTQMQVYEMLPVLSHFAVHGNLPYLPDVKGTTMNQTPNKTPTLTYSVDNGATYQDAPQGVRVSYDNVEVVIDGEETNGRIQVNHSHEGMILDTFGSVVHPHDTHVGTASFDLEDMIDLTITVDTADVD
jgi:hypothetical protein